MRLLIISESPLHLCDGSYYAVDPWIRFVQHLAGSEERVTLLAPVTNAARPPSEAWRLDRGALRIEHHDFYNSYLGFARLWLSRHRAWRRRIHALAARHDLLALRLPSPSLSLVMRVARRCKRPIVLLVAGDVKGQSDRLMRSRGAQRLLFTAIINLLVRQEVRYGRQAAGVFAYSSELAHRHRHARVRMMRTPHLRAEDFVVRADTCAGDEIRLLRVCWLIPSKGLESLLEATALVVRAGRPVRLTIVGHERTAGYRRTLEELARKLGIGSRVEFRGWVPFDAMGPVYDASDIQIISSLAEGTPRCIVEGMARGLPLVCTAVGGCGDSLKDGETALLVAPANPPAMAEAIQRVIGDRDLRRALIANGYALARSATFDALGPAFAEELRAMAHPVSPVGPLIKSPAPAE